MRAENHKELQTVQCHLNKSNLLKIIKTKIYKKKLNLCIQIFFYNLLLQLKTVSKKFSSTSFFNYNLIFIKKMFKLGIK